MDIDDPRQMTVEQALGLDGLADVSAALACRCSCHLRRFGRPDHFDPDGTSMYDRIPALAGSGPLHDDGRSCPCQLTPEQRRQATVDMFAALDEVREARERTPEHRAGPIDLERARAVAAGHGVRDVTVLTQACPLQVTATCDDGQLYLRERHGSYRVELDGQVIGTGTDGDLEPGPAWAADHLVGAVHLRGPVRRCVDVIVEALARHRAAGCGHRDARVFCPDCGTFDAGR